MGTLAVQERFFVEAVGKYYNADNAAGYQCVDLFHAYGTAIFGGSPTWQEHSGWGNAEDLFWGPPEYYWKKIQNSPDPNHLPERGDVVIWGGTPDWGINPYGHIAVLLDVSREGGLFLQMDGGTQSAAFIGWLGWDNPGTGPVVGWLRPNFDDDPALPSSPQLKPMERINGPHVTNQRSEPKLGDNVIRKIEPGAREIWDGFVIGETVQTADGPKNVWFKDKDGYALAALFEDESVTGLPDLTPAKYIEPAWNERDTVTPDGARMRALPDKNADIMEVFMPDRRLTFKGYVIGTDPYGDGRRKWFVGAFSGGFVHESGLTNPDPGALPDLTPSVPVPPVEKPYDFEPAFEVLEGVLVEKLPAHLTNVDTGNFPADPGQAVWHWFGEPPIPFTSPLGEWTRPNSYKSPHFQVGETRIGQITGLHDRAYHAGPSGNVRVGIEVDPHVTERNPDGTPTVRALAIRRNCRALDAALTQHYGRKLAPSLHKDVPGNATSCSPIDLNWLLGAEAPTEPPVVDIPGPDHADERAVLTRFFAWLLDLFLNRKKV